MNVQVNGGSLPYTYQWNTVPASTQQAVSNIPSGTYNVTVIDDNGCQTTTTVNVGDIAGPTASFIADPSNADINEQINFSDMSIGAITWYWTFGDGYDDNIQHTSHIYPLPGTYPVTLYVEDNFTCRDSVTMNVVVNPLFFLYIPNSFSPNGDGINDVFKPEIIGAHPAKA